ncbi:MAG: ribbon-helix-helix domain-containing protein [Actinomycetota bacterium]
METITISMPESLKGFLDAQVRTLGYESVSDYVNDVLREAQGRVTDQRLESHLLNGLDSGEDIEVTGAFWAELHSETDRRIADCQRA